MKSQAEIEQANVEKVRAAFDAFNRGDREAMLEMGSSDDFVYDWTRSIGPNRGIYRGLEGFTQFVNDQWSTFDEVRLEPHELIPRGNHVVAVLSVHARGRGGVPVSANSTHLYTFENGRLVRVTLFQEREEALAAAN